MYLNYVISFEQILSGPVGSVVSWTIWVVGSNPIVSHISIFFFFQIEETCTFMNSSSLKYHLIALFTDTAIIRFEEYFRMPRGHEHISFVYFRALFGTFFPKVFLE